MRIYVLTQEDSFYIPVLLDHLFSERRDVLGLGIVPGELRSNHFLRYLRFMGVRDFAMQSANLAAHRALATAGRLLPMRRSFSVEHAARRHRVPHERVPCVNAPAFVDSLRRREIDLLVSVACPQILKGELLAVPRRGAINIHGALLPDYQGLLPSFWVLANGERVTGVTVHFMSEQVDGGDVVLQRTVAIEERDTVHSLVKRSKIGVGKQLLVEAIEQIEAGAVTRKPMDGSRARYFGFPDAQAVRRFRAQGRRFI
jgi:methionyl-tRNA formyltransferase